MFSDLHSSLARNNVAALSADVASNSASCWHLFESHITAGRNCDGKALKQWLFARVARSKDPALKVVRGGVRSLARDAFRVNIAAEMTNKRCVEIDAPVSNSDEMDFSIESMLPAQCDEISEVERRDLENIAREFVGEIFEDMSFTQRIVLLAKALGISLAHPLVAEATGLRKSMINRIWHSTLKNLVKQVDQSFASEDRQIRFLIAEMSIEDQKNRIISWSKVEKRCAKLLEISRAL